jgi:O-antigen ligase
MNVNDLYMRSFGTFFHPNVFAEFLGAVFLAALVAFLWERTRKSWFYLATALCIMAGLLSTLSRSGLLAVWLTLFLMLFWLIRRRQMPGGKLVMVGLLVCLPLLPFIFNRTLSGRLIGINREGLEKYTYFQEKPLAGDPNYDIAQRLLSYDSAFEVLKHNWLFGVGYRLFKHAHNFYLQLWLDMGLLGVAAFFLIIKKHLAAVFPLLKSEVAVRQKIAVISLFVSVFFLIKGLGDVIWCRQLWGFFLGLGFLFASPEKKTSAGR